MALVESLGATGSLRAVEIIAINYMILRPKKMFGRLRLARTKEKGAEKITDDAADL